jgi:Recombinational DNA repair protein (RecF pathway)
MYLYLPTTNAGNKLIIFSMYQTTRAIVLHTVKYSETSIITKLYTEKYGLVSFLIKGIRSVKGRNKAALFQPLRILEITYSHRQNKNLQYIRGIL